MTELRHAHHSPLEKALLISENEQDTPLAKEIFLALLQSPGTSERIAGSVIAGHPMPDCYRSVDLEECDYYYRLALTAFHAAKMFNQATDDKKHG